MTLYLYVDIDGVTLDTEKRDQEARKNVTRWLSDVVKILSDKAYKQAYDDLFYSLNGFWNPSLFKDDTPLPGVPELLDRLETDLHANITFLSSCPDDVQEETFGTLDEYGMAESVFGQARPILLKPSGARPKGAYEVSTPYWKVSTIQTHLSFLEQIGAEIDWVVLIDDNKKTREHFLASLDTMNGVGVLAFSELSQMVFEILLTCQKKEEDQ